MQRSPTPSAAAMNAGKRPHQRRQQRRLGVIRSTALACLLAALPAGATGDLPTASPESVGMSSERLERIGVGMRRLIDAGKIPGTVTLVARRGKVVHFEAHGQRNVEAGLPMERDTIFRLYSQTKPVTGAALMMLFEEGHFLMTDPVAKYLPEFADMRVYVGEEDGEIVTEPARDMTIGQLATHTAGLTYEFIPGPVGEMYTSSGVAGSAGEAPHGDLAGWTKALAELPLIAQPGTEWHYSVGMDVLGRLVEVVSGMSFGEFLHTRLFEPLDMRDTGFHVPADKADRLVAMVARTDDGLVSAGSPGNDPFLRPPEWFSGGGGLVSTARDYFRFSQMLLNEGELDGTRLLEPETVRLMTRNHLPDELTPISGGVDDRGFGLGFAVALTDGAGSYSWSGIANTYFWVDPANEIVAMAWTQLRPYGGAPLNRILRRIVYDAISR